MILMSCRGTGGIKWMIDGMKILLSVSLSGSVLILLILIMKPLYRNRFNRAWQYYIWLVVIARLLLPFTPEFSLTGNAFHELESRWTWDTESAVDQGRNGSLDGNQPSDSQADPVGGVNDSHAAMSGSHEGVSVGREDVTIGQKESVKTGEVSVFHSLIVLWGLSAFILFLRKVIAYRRFVSFVKEGRKELSGEDILNRLAEASRRAGVKRAVGIYSNSRISSPMLIGFFRPFIVLPDAEMDTSALQLVMEHELIHYKRLDMLYKWLVQITQCIHWFNPLMYIMGKEINRDCELACDEAVIRSLKREEKISYGETLIASLQSHKTRRTSVASLTLSEGGKQIKERLDAIMSYKKKSKGSVVMAFALSLVLSGGAVLFGAYAVQEVSAAAKPDNPRAVMGRGSTEKADTPWTDGNEEKNSQQYTYRQSGYYQSPYIFELGWNLSDKGYEAYADKAELTLSDGSIVSVSFDRTCREEAKDQDVLLALTSLIDLCKEQEGESLALEKPLVVSVRYVGDRDLNELAEEYYGEELTRFSAIFPILEEEVRLKYRDRMFSDRKVAYFSSVLQKMDKEYISGCAEKAYTEGNISFFSCVLSYLTEEQKLSWLERAEKEQPTISAIIRDSL